MQSVLGVPSYLYLDVTLHIEWTFGGDIGAIVVLGICWVIRYQIVVSCLGTRCALDSWVIRLYLLDSY